MNPENACQITVYTFLFCTYCFSTNFHTIVTAQSSEDVTAVLVQKAAKVACTLSNVEALH